MSELAAIVHLSPFYFARAFQKEVGLPPHAYLETVRIAHGRVLLLRGVPIADVSAAIGYGDQSHFTPSVQARAWDDAGTGGPQPRNGWLIEHCELARLNRSSRWSLQDETQSASATDPTGPFISPDPIVPISFASCNAAGIDWEETYFAGPGASIQPAVAAYY